MPRSTKFQQTVADLEFAEADRENAIETLREHIDRLRTDHTEKRRERIADAAVIALLLWSASGFLWAFMGFAEWLMR